MSDQKNGAGSMTNDESPTERRLKGFDPFISLFPLFYDYLHGGDGRDAFSYEQHLEAVA